MVNMVDERFELMAVIFRLAGRPEYSDLGTDYQREVAETFASSVAHEAVEYAKSLPLGYDAVFKFSVHIEKKGRRFAFIKDIDSLFDGRWTDKSAKKFLILLNQFYMDTDYATFFNAHNALFEQCTQTFIDQAYGKIDFSWFRKYIGPSNLRCIYSLSSGNYGATVNNQIICCLVRRDGGALVHEYCHGFANPIADQWYHENPEFQKWCDDSVNPEQMPYYNNGFAMAREYVTRAYTVLYQVQHGAELGPCLAAERHSNGRDSFRYIGQIYHMVAEFDQFKQQYAL